jgi:hypothetical protein
MKTWFRGMGFVPRICFVPVSGQSEISTESSPYLRAEPSGGRFAPFVESVRRNQTPSLAECLPERGRFVDSLSSGVDGLVRNLLVFCPIRN